MCGALCVWVVRLCCVAAIVFLYLVFRRKSRIWQASLDLSRLSQRLLVASVVVFLCLFLVVLSQLSGQGEWLENGPVYDDSLEAVQDGNQYNYLADAFLNGSVKLNLPQSKILESMDNPYDTELRRELNSTAHEPIYWDYAYYQGSYYCYFGVLPCLLTFLPYKALTGSDLRCDYVVVLFACLMLVAGAFFLANFAHVFYEGLSLGAYLVGLIALFSSSGLLEQVYFPRIYPIPILSALMFCFLGLGLLLKAKGRFINDGTHTKGYLLVGSLCLASTLGCRPQYVVVSLLVVALFWEEIKRRLFFSKKGLANTMAVILPFMAVAIPICLYNYVRFGSPFNFGASYNLTGADMTAYAFSLKRTVMRSAEYLFLPPVLQSSFPFLHAVDELPGTLAWMLWTNEPVYGGFFAFAPVTFLLLGLCFRGVRKSLKHRGLLMFDAVSIALALLVIAIVSHVSGITMRYFADFAWLMIIPSITVIWQFCEQERSCGLIRFSGWLAALALLGTPLYLWTYLVPSKFGSLSSMNPELYGFIASLFGF